MAVFDWWLLIVGLVIGAGLVWLVLADASRREHDILDDETPVEAAWISATLADEGTAVDPVTAERILRLHRTYLESLPPDEPADGEAAAGDEAAGSDVSADVTAERRLPAEPQAQLEAPDKAPRQRDVPRDPLPARDR
jgi:hypothetical protein